IDMDERADLWSLEDRQQGASNTGFAGAAQGGKASEDLAVSESAFDDARPVAMRDTAHGSAKVRAYTFLDPGADPGSKQSDDADRQSQSQSQGGSHQSQGFRRDH
ncbi:hypothetical protein ACCS96_46185, partial [Rhizobium ruizarguesonis]